MNEKRNTGLSTFNVALMYVSAIMGAGFASGREIWQFFGVFESKGISGVIIVALLFVLSGLVTAFIAIKLNTSDYGKIIVPFESKAVKEAVGWFMAIMLFTVLITMTAAGGSMLNQQFGIPKWIGGVIIDILVIVTVLGDFERVSSVFRYIMPVLLVTVIAVSLVLVIGELPDSGVRAELQPSPAAPTWLLGAFLYISYNVLALIPLVAKSAINAKSNRVGIIGSMLGGLFLGLMAIVIVLALQKDMMYSQAMDMPMLGYASRLGKVVGFWYTLILFAAIYSAATSGFYGFSLKIRNGKNKKTILIAFSILAYVLGLFGFKNVVAYMFPIEGYVGFAIIAMILINFVKTAIKKENEKQ